MISRLHIQAGCRDNTSYLKNAFYCQPFKLADITEYKSDNKLRLMLMTSSPGMLDGDAYDVHVELFENSSVELETQAYQRLFAMKKGATQQWLVSMGEGSSFVFIPQPAVPHQSSIYKSIGRLYLAKDCFLAWGEVVTCGRKLNGEIFKFSSYHTITEVYLSGKLIIKENLLMAPRTTDLFIVGQLEGYTHQASLTCLLNVANLNPVIDAVYHFLEQERDIESGVSAVHANAFIVRILGNKAEQLYHILKLIAGMVESFHERKQYIKPTAYAR